MDTEKPRRFLVTSDPLTWFEGRHRKRGNELKLENCNVSEAGKSPQKWCIWSWFTYITAWSLRVRHSVKGKRNEFDKENAKRQKEKRARNGEREYIIHIYRCMCNPAHPRYLHGCHVKCANNHGPTRSRGPLGRWGPGRSKSPREIVKALDFFTFLSRSCSSIAL